MDDHLWAGGEAQADLLRQTHADHPSVRYAVKLDTSEATRAECQSILTVSDGKVGEALGMGRIKRLEGENTVAEVRVALEGLDEAHIIDRKIMAVLEWHAQTFGPGPDVLVEAGRRASRGPD